MNNLILGTANFGEPYGISRQNRISLETIEQILNLAQKTGINHFDTARSYGDSELILGKFLNKAQPLYIDSKIGSAECESVHSIIAAVNKSLSILGIAKLNTLYLHNADLLSGDNALIIKQGMEKVIELGLANHLGVSVYTFKQLTEAKNSFPSLIVFQVLENICDRRLFYLKELMDFTNKGNIVNIRSIFLQGLLLMNSKNLQLNLKGATESIESLNEYAGKNNVSVTNLCVAYAKMIPWANKYVVGVESASQLQETIDSKFQLEKNWERHISSLPEELKDPRFW